MIPKIVLTGGPCGGKSTTISALEAKYGNKVRFVKEAATMLMSSGFPAPGRDLSFSPGWIENFQDAIIGVQVGNEGASEIAASENGASLLVCDRGILDSAAYVTGGLPVLEERYLQKYGLNVYDVCDRYDMVIHLESLATANPSLFGKAGNETRYESLEDAQSLELRTRDAWQAHPNWYFIEGDRGVDYVVNQVLELIAPFINKEIERKFVLYDGEIPDGSMETIRQKYILSGPFEMRIRGFDKHMATIGIKSSGGLSRYAWEETLPYHLFEELYKQVDGNEIIKRRHYVPYGDLTLEIDVYEGELEGLTILECEFPSEEIAEQFVLPEWATNIHEVTNDPRYKNKSLAVNGPPGE